jgi:hypothetical protein
MMALSGKTKQIFLWSLMLTGMILHFNYHISGIFYGIDLVKPGATGEEPSSLLVIRTLFYHLPVVWILLIMYTRSRVADLVLLILSGLYLLAHAFHLAGEFRSEDKNLSQISLLFLVLVLAAALSYEHFRSYRSHGAGSGESV